MKWLKIIKKFQQLLKNSMKFNKKKTNLNRQLEILKNITVFIERGYSLNETLKLINFRYDLSQFILELEEGMQVSEIFKELNYDSDILLIMEIAEVSGDIKSGLSQCVKILEQKTKNQNQVFELIKYPLLLALIMSIALLFVSKFLIPQFESIYVDFGMTLDGMINVLFNLIELFPYILLISMFCILFIAVRFQKMKYEKKLKLMLKYKISRRYYLAIYNQIFVIHISNLMKVGLRVDEVFSVLSNQVHNKFLQKEAQRIMEELKEGKSIHEAISNKYYSDELIMLVKDGETYATLIHNLDNYCIYIQTKNDEKTKSLMFLIQPIFYGLFGILIIVLYASIFIPMFEMMDAL